MVESSRGRIATDEQGNTYSDGRMCLTQDCLDNTVEWVNSATVADMTDGSVSLPLNRPLLVLLLCVLMAAALWRLFVTHGARRAQVWISGSCGSLRIDSMRGVVPPGQVATHPIVLRRRVCLLPWPTSAAHRWHGASSVCNGRCGCLLECRVAGRVGWAERLRRVV